MLLVSDVHGAAAALRRVAAAADQPLLVLGDLVNFIDYRTYEGIVSAVLGVDVVREMVRLRTSRKWDEARRVWRASYDGTESDLRREYGHLMEEAYSEVCPALAGSGAIVTYGNVDHVGLLEKALPGDCTFVADAATFDIEGHRVGVVGGGAPTPLGVPGEVGDDEMTARLESIGEVDILCTHVAPAVPPLATDVIGGSHKGSRPVLAYLQRSRPRYHYFGDIHQPQATSWRVGSTVCRNVGYFRATGRPVEHRP
jgi:Icc-related predicted phosphoesterase